MLSFNGHFYFGGILVCSKLLTKAFRFRNNVHASSWSLVRSILSLDSEETSSYPKGNKIDVE